MKNTLLVIATFYALAINAATIKNNDSCDVAVLPAATLLLPYFEVDVNAPATTASTTLFTVVNTTQSPQIARVTLWTDLGYPVVNFNLFLTGYDVQPINLYDILVKRTIAPPNGATSDAPVGDRSLLNDANPKFAPGAVDACAHNPGPISADIANDIVNALTFGHISGCGEPQVGLTHAKAIGYATIDLVNTCGATFPTSAGYYNELLYDNVLTGDYQVVSPNPVTGNYASGNPLVHIRAIADGLPYTFYDRYTPRNTPAIDRRQPLPSVFAARYIQSGFSSFNANFQIWREAITGADATCSAYAQNNGTASKITEVIRFDEHENPTTSGGICVRPCPHDIFFPATSSTSTSSGIYPPLSVSGDIGGWMYLNLNNAGSPAYSKTRASQNWVTVSMFAEGRFSVMFDATALANGCTPPRSQGATIGPAP